MVCEFFIYAKKEEKDMAKIKTLGNAIKLSTSITKDVADEVSAFNNSAFQLKDKEGTPFFKIAFGEGSYSKYGVTFDSYDEEGFYLMVCAETPEGEKLTRDVIKKEFASIVYKLKAVERQVALTYKHMQEMGEFIDEDIEIEGECRCESCDAAIVDDTLMEAEPTEE